MNDRQHYVDQMKIRLDQWNSDIDVLETRVNEIGSEMKDEYTRQLDMLQEKREDAVAKFEQLQNTTDSAWDDLKDGFEEARISIGHAFDSAKSKFRAEKRSSERSAT